MIDTKIDQLQLIAIIGCRMREARELCGYSQAKAAELIGYKNSSKLAKIENASDTKSVPIGTLRRAAEIYNVSLDFLFGISDIPDRAKMIEREQIVIANWIHDRLFQAKKNPAIRPGGISSIK